MTDIAKKSQRREGVRRPAAASRLAVPQLLDEISRAVGLRQKAIASGSHSVVVMAYTDRIKALSKQLRRMGIDPSNRR